MPDKIKMNFTRPIVFVFAVLALAALVLGMQFGFLQHQRDNASDTTATVLPDARSIATFNLTDDQGQPFTNASLQGHWTLMFFGFTHCRQICPTTMQSLKLVYQLLRVNKITLPQVVLVSIDPARDSISRLNEYVHAFDKQFRGAVGNKNEIDALTQSMGIVYAAVQGNENSTNDHYDIDHSGTLVLLNPEGKIKAFFSMPHEPKTIAEDYKQIIREGNHA